jgi:hypothetical protein
MKYSHGDKNNIKKTASTSGYKSHGEFGKIVNSKYTASSSASIAATASEKPSFSASASSTCALIEAFGTDMKTPALAGVFLAGDKV